MNKKVYLVFLLTLTVVECARPISRQKFPSRRPTRVPVPAKTRVVRSRGEVIENLFNVYDPSFLAVVWPKLTNRVHLYVSRPCWEDLNLFYKDLADGRAWAYSAVDASGRYPSGLFRGSRFWLGSKKSCLKLDSNFIADTNETLDEFHNSDYLNAILKREKYFDGGAEEWRNLIQRDELMRRLVAADNAPPHHLAYTAVDLMLNLTKVTMTQSYDITLGVCLPRSCTLEDVTSVINFSIMINDNFKSNKTLPRVIKVTSLRQIENYYDIKTDIGAIVLILFTVFLILIALIATIVDLKLIKCRPRHRSSMSFDLQKINNKTMDAERNMHDNHSDLKESNLVDMETMTINNINDANNINLVTLKKVMKPNAMPPSITLDVVSMERVAGLTGSCKRCGKYKKQCNNALRRPTNTLPACPRVKSFASLTTEVNKSHNLLKSLLLCFSLKYSWKRIFNPNTSNRDLCFVHALKIAATFWIIFVHVAMIANYVSDDAGDLNNYNNAYYILATGTLAFDTMFFVSGVVSAHHFLFVRRQHAAQVAAQVARLGGACAHILHFVCFVTNRAIRLLPSYAYVILLSATVARSLRHTAALALPEADDVTCANYWWRNLLYITTLFPKNQQCTQISWYMSLETLLHISGLLTCAVSSRRLLAALAAAAVLLLAATDVSAAYEQFSMHMSTVFALYSTLIERPLSRVAPYFLGVMAGWLVHRVDGDIYISTPRATFLWVICVLVAVSSLSLPYLTSGWVCAWLHLSWPIALLWPAVALATDLAAPARRVLDNPIVAALSRLSHSMLLLHGVIARALLLSDDVTHTATIWSYFAGTTLLTIPGALVLSLLIETPCCSLLRRLSDYAS